MAQLPGGTGHPRGDNGPVCLGKPRRSRVAGDILLSRIVRGVWRPGDRLPSERMLSDELSMSRASVREAIRGLEALGLVDVRHGRGVFVRDTSEPISPLFASWSAEHEYAIGEVLAFRLLLEPELAALAAERADDTFVAALDAILQAMDEAATSGDLVGLVQCDTAFHDAITRRAGNRLYADLLGRVTGLLIESRRISLGVPGRADKVIARHRAVADGIRRRDPAAAHGAMREHLAGFSREMRVAPVG
jgi:GntR family transcriptional regulator, transcriptional repressor for pyruvate dehydrogenase complex